MEKVSEKIELLKQQNNLPEVIVIFEFLLKCHSQIINSANINFQLVTTLFTHVLPQIYFVDPGTNQELIRAKALIEKLFTSSVGVNNLVNKITLYNGDNLTNSQATNSIINILLSILFQDTSKHDLIYKLLTNNGQISNLNQLKISMSNINSLFFSAKIFNMINDYNAKSETKLPTVISNEILDPILNISSYSKWLNHQYYYLVYELAYNDLDLTRPTLSLLRICLGNAEIVLRDLLVIPINDNVYWKRLESFKQVYKKFTKLNKQQIVLTFLFDKFLFKLLNKTIITKLNYFNLVYIVNYYLNFFGFVSDINYEIVVLAMFKKYNIVKRSSLLVMLHSIILNFKANSTSNSDFISKFKSFIIKFWADAAFVRNSSVDVQEALTVFLLIYLNYLSQNQEIEIFLQQLMIDENIIGSMSIHLEQPLTKVRYMGVVFMERLSHLSKSPNKLEFKMKEAKIYEHDLLKINDSLNLDDMCKSFQEHNFNSIDFMKESLNKETLKIEDKNLIYGNKVPLIQHSHDMMKVKNDFSQLTITPVSDDEKVDSDDEDYHDPTLAKQNNTVPTTPIYMKDLHSYLIDASKEDPFQSQLKRKIALESFSEIVRLRRDFHDEITFWSEKLCVAILNLKTDGLVLGGKKTSINHEGIETPIADSPAEEEQLKYYNNLKLSSLITLIVVNQSTIPKFLVKQLLNGDYSIHERLLIINSFGLGARELKGYKDNINHENLRVEASLKLKRQIGNRRKNVFPSNKLEGEMHKSFLLLDENYSEQTEAENLLTAHDINVELESHRLDNITNQIDRGVNQQSMALINEKVGPSDQGKVIKISSRLLKEREKKLKTGNVMQEKVDQYSLSSYENFIAPFITIWVTLNGNTRSLGSYSNLIINSYLKNFIILVNCAYPTAVYLTEIITEAFEVLRSLKSIISSFLSFPNYGGTNSVTISEMSNILESQLYLLLVIFQMTNRTILILRFESQVVSFFNWLNYLFDNFDNIFGDAPMFLKNKSLIANCLLQISEILQKQLGPINNV